MSRPPRPDDDRPAPGGRGANRGGGVESPGGVVRDRAYWMSRPAAERLAEVERLRRERHGPDYDEGEMAKVVRIVRMSTGEVLKVLGDDADA